MMAKYCLSCGHSSSAHRMLRTEYGGWPYEYEICRSCNGCRCDFIFDRARWQRTKPATFERNGMPLLASIERQMAAHPDWYERAS